MESGIRENFAGRIRNPGLWNSEYSSSNAEITTNELLTIGIQNPRSTGKDWIQYLKSRIEGVESRIEDRLGLPHMGRVIG